MATKRKQGRKKPSPEWLTTGEAARYLGVSVDKVRELDESGELRASRTKGKHRRFSRKALDAYATRNGRGKARQDERATAGSSCGTASTRVSGCTMVSE